MLDTGPEMTSKAMFLGSAQADMRLRFFDLGKPIPNVFVEGYNARFWETCLNEYWFTSLADTQQTIES